MVKKKLIILAAGGTGGHVFPAQSLIDTIKKHGTYKPVLICDTRAEQYLKGSLKRVKKISIASSNLSGNVINKVMGLCFITLGTIRVLSFFIRKRPKMVVGFGGYPSLPSLFAAKILGIPVVIHEQNSVLGRVNRFFQTNARKIALGFPDTKMLDNKSHSKAVWVGNPIRKEVISYKSKANTSKNIKIVIIAGSQGSQLLTETACKAICQMPKTIQKNLKIVHQVPKNLYTEIKQAYEQQGIHCNISSFFDDIGSLLSKADIILARAGASTIAEITALGKSSILVPLGIAMDNHQYHNAKFLSNNQAAILIEEHKFKPNFLCEQLISLIKNKDLRAEYQTKAKKLYKKDSNIKLYEIIEKELNL